MTETRHTFMRVSEVAAELGVSRQRVYQLIDAHKIPFVRLGARKIVIPRASWDAFCEAQAQLAVENLAAVQAAEPIAS